MARALVLGMVLAVIAIGGSAGPAAAFDLGETASANAVVSGAGQCELVTPDAGSDPCGLGVLAQPQARWEPFAGTRFSAKLGFAAGNALNDVTPFHLSPWAADLADTVIDINGRGRDALLTANYRQEFHLDTARHLAIVGGIIDSTDYIDTNAFANDELNQFMNEALVNAVLVAPPSYDYGGALLINVDATGLRGVYMNVGENDNGRSYNYFAGELAHRFGTRWGTGHLRLLVSGTDAAFVTPDGRDLAQLFGVSVSADQALSDAFGLFVRAGWQSTAASVDYGAEITGGGRLRGGAWGRPNDSIGLGAGILFAGNQDLENTAIAELYYRAKLGDALSVTFDVQAMRDQRELGVVHGVIAGVRATASF